MLPAIQWKHDRVIMIDQRKLPLEEVYVECRDEDEVARAIETMIIRGAPAIGIAAAFGVALGVMGLQDDARLDEEFERIVARLHRTRPTARNLFWALERMKKAFLENRALPLGRLKARLVDEALAMEREDVEANRKIGFFGKSVIRDGDAVLTHCNAGELATAGYGTAIGVIRAAHEAGMKVRVFADETRPFLQGARLTCWELDRLGVPVTLIADNMAGWLMQRAEVQLVITGADRVAMNGDTANKIGTYSVAVLAREHGIPFYVAAPLSTVDASIADGGRIPIEERPEAEVREVQGCLLTLPHIKVRNPAFDVTPARLITGIITERGIARPPFQETLAGWMKEP